MGFYQIKSTQKIPASKSEIWDFISSPKNLREITPDELDFEITSKDLPEKMYTGMIITYKVRPLFGIKMTWVTEITHVEDGQFFIDEQRVGPYSIWHHQHHIKEVEGGVEMTDIVSYRPPFGFLGSIANALIIKGQLKKIFAHREKAIVERFGTC